MFLKSKKKRKEKKKKENQRQQQIKEQHSNDNTLSSKKGTHIHTLKTSIEVDKIIIRNNAGNTDFFWQAKSGLDRRSLCQGRVL